MPAIYTPAIARRIAATLFVTQSLASAALIASGTVNPIVGATLGGRDAWGGLPTTLMLLGAASAAYPAGRLMERFGRRLGLALGFLAGMAGMLLSASAILARSFPLFLFGLLLLGCSRGAIDQSRYAAADAQAPERRARAISAVVFAGTIGAIGGPALVAPLGQLAARLGLDPLAGPFVCGAAFFALAGALIAALLRPDPRDIGRALAADFPDTRYAEGQVRPLAAIMRAREAWLALAAMVIGQGVMLMVMTMVPLHMHHHGHGLGDVSLVIMAHTLGMFGLSFATGALADRLGRGGTIAIGAGLLIGGSLLAPASLATPTIALALFLVGLGWNLCYIAGSSLLADLLAPAERAHVQGANDLAVNLASAISSLSSGFVMELLGFGMLGLLAAGLASIPLGLLGWRALAHARGTVARIP